MSELLDRLDALLDEAASVTAASGFADDVAGVRQRLHRPLRVAIAGRAKAGKSTLLNALVGERLAATDATECTRIVTWYRHDLGYSVTAVLRSGEQRALDFDRDDGLSIRLGDLAVQEIERLEVGWPSSRLASMTLIDTPGLDSARPESGARTMAAVVGDDAAAGEADAVVYLMRHLHRADAEFLEAFERAAIRSASPVNAVALLSRADEIGGGRMDALESAASIAARYAADPAVSSLAFTVLPVAGLLAETAASLREREVAWLRELARTEDDALRAVLLSADRFRDRDENPLRADAREQLLRRLGMFGLRLAVRVVRDRPAITTPELAALLVDASGLRRLEAVIRRSFADRAEVLKARSALSRLRSIAARAQAMSATGAQALARELERFEAASPELSQLRLRHLVQSRVAHLADDERVELERLFEPASIAERLGQPVGTGPTALRPLVLAGVERWRTRAADPLLDRQTVEVAEGVVRAYEGLFRDLERAIAAVR